MGEEEQSRNICTPKNHLQVLMNIDYYQPLFVRIDIRIDLRSFFNSWQDFQTYDHIICFVYCRRLDYAF